jgi:hypothetical protein
VAIELPSRKFWKKYPYEIAQLTSLNILLTNIRVYIISDTPKTEGSHAQDFQKRLESCRKIAANISNGKVSQTIFDFNFFKVKRSKSLKNVTYLNDLKVCFPLYNLLYSKRQ